MTTRSRRVLWAGLFVAAVCVVAVRWQFSRDLASATARAAQGSAVLTTRCGPIEVQQAGEGIPLLMIHGSGGGHDQGMAWARPLAQHGVRVIAMSRFGYLRTPRPADASPEAQADAHVCLLDALGIGRAAVMGVSAGGPSALQMAIRHPDRVSALVLVVPIAHKPGTVADSAPPVSDDKDALAAAPARLGLPVLDRAAPGARPAHPPCAGHAARAGGRAPAPQERARVNDLAERILPVSQPRRRACATTRGLGKRLRPLRAGVDPRADAGGQRARRRLRHLRRAQYTASRIPGARFLGFDDGGHLLVGHDEEVRDEIVRWLRAAKPA